MSVYRAEHQQPGPSAPAFVDDDVVRRAGAQVQNLISELFEKQLQIDQVPGVRVGGDAGEHDGPRRLGWRRGEQAGHDGWATGRRGWSDAARDPALAGDVTMLTESSTSLHRWMASSSSLPLATT